MTLVYFEVKMCKFVNLGRKVKQEILKKTPPAFFIGLDAIIGINNPELSDLLNSDKNVVAQIVPLSRKMKRTIYVYSDRIKSEELIETILHELAHNFRIHNGSFYPGIYAANKIYREREENVVNRIAKKLLTRGYI